MNDDSFIVKDLPKFVDAARTLVFNSFGKQASKGNIDEMLMVVKPEEKDELDSVLSYEEALLITKGLVVQKQHKKTDKIYFVLTDKIFMEILESLNDRMVSNMLNNLVNKGLLETGYDAESNDFVFWIKDNEKDEETPETD